ncbi:hypothetical protein BDV11DRAFT_187457 [Aspergillus similis]
MNHVVLLFASGSKSILNNLAASMTGIGSGFLGAISADLGYVIHHCDFTSESSLARAEMPWWLLMHWKALELLG